LANYYQPDSDSPTGDQSAVCYINSEGD